MRAALKSRWTGSVIIFLMTFIAGLVLSPDAMPVVRAVKGLMPISGPPLIVYSTTRLDYLDGQTYPVTMSDIRSKILDMDVLNGILMRMGFTRRSDSVYFPPCLALTDINGATIKKLPQAVRQTSTLSMNSTGTTIGWVANDNLLRLDLNSDEISSTNIGIGNHGPIVSIKILLPNTGSSALFVTLRERIRGMVLLWWNPYKLELEHLQTSWGNDNIRWWDLNVVRWPQLACDLSDDGSMVIDIDTLEAGKYVMNLHSADNDTVRLMEMRDADEMVFCPAFMPDGESFVYLHYDIAEGETGQVELMFRDLELNSEPVLIAQFPAVCDVAPQGRLKEPPAYLLIDSYSTENPEAVIIGANLDPEAEPSDSPSDRYVNVVRLEGTPPELIYLGGFEIDRAQPWIDFVGAKGILSYYNSYMLVDLKTGEESKKIRFDGPPGDIICTSGY